jgi:restriction endonuclease S subunit
LGIVKQHRRPITAIISPLYGVFAPANRHIGYIIEAFFESPSRSVNYLDPLAQKGAKNTIQLSNERFLSGRIVLPTSEPEQQKIAECLSSVDELIAAQARKVDALKTHKKGLMQQLFPREGETQPRLRFPEFQNAGEWQIKPFAKLFSIGNGRDHKYLASGDIPVYGSGGYMRSVDDYLYDGESVCIGRKGTINNPMFLTGKFWTVDTLFYTLPEQQRIASCLSSLDALITAETQKLDALKTHKKGLMQQLFPSPEAVEV